MESDLFFVTLPSSFLHNSRSFCSTLFALFHNLPVFVCLHVQGD